MRPLYMVVLVLLLSCCSGSTVQVSNTVDTEREVSTAHDGCRRFSHARWNPWVGEGVFGNRVGEREHYHQFLQSVELEFRPSSEAAKTSLADWFLCSDLSDDARPHLGIAADSSDYVVRAAAYAAYAEYMRRDYQDFLLLSLKLFKCLEDTDPRVKCFCLSMIADTGHPKLREMLEQRHKRYPEDNPKMRELYEGAIAILDVKIGLAEGDLNALKLRYRFDACSDLSISPIPQDTDTDDKTGEQ